MEMNLEWGGGGEKGIQDICTYNLVYLLNGWLNNAY